MSGGITVTATYISGGTDGLGIAGLQIVSSAAFPTDPMITATLQGGQLVVSWDSPLIFQLQYRTDLGQGSWTDEPTPAVVTGNQAGPCACRPPAPPGSSVWLWSRKRPRRDCQAGLVFGPARRDLAKEYEKQIMKHLKLAVADPSDFPFAPARVYLNRIARGHCDHRHPGRPAVASIGACQAQNASGSVHEQQQANDAGLENVRG